MKRAALEADDLLSCRVIVPSKSVKKMTLGLSFRASGYGISARGRRSIEG